MKKRDWVGEYDKHFEGMHLFNEFIQEHPGIDKKVKRAVLEALVDGLIAPHTKAKVRRDPPTNILTLISMGKLEVVA